jgi:hypothetical protein
MPKAGYVASDATRRAVELYDSRAAWINWSIRNRVTQKSCPWFDYSGPGIYHDHLGVRASPASGYIRISNW